MILVSNTHRREETVWVVDTQPGIWVTYKVVKLTSVYNLKKSVKIIARDDFQLYLNSGGIIGITFQDE